MLRLSPKRPPPLGVWRLGGDDGCVTRREHGPGRWIMGQRPFGHGKGLAAGPIGLRN